MPLFSCWQELYLFRRLVHLKKMEKCTFITVYSFHSEAHHHNINPSYPAIFIFFSSVDPQYICWGNISQMPIFLSTTAMNLFWLVLICNYMPLLCCRFQRGCSLTCSRASHQTATSVWSNSSCPAGSLERSGTHSRSWFWPPWCRSHTWRHWRGNLCVSETQTGTDLKGTKSTEGKYYDRLQLETIVFLWI